jgi:hypothetical protein
LDGYFKTAPNFPGKGFAEKISMAKTSCSWKCSARDTLLFEGEVIFAKDKPGDLSELQHDSEKTP